MKVWDDVLLGDWLCFSSKQEGPVQVCENDAGLDRRLKSMVCHILRRRISFPSSFVFSS